MVANSVLVGMAESHVLKDSGQFVCQGLGSSLAIALFDPVSKAGGMAQLMLPKSCSEDTCVHPARFVDSGIDELLAQIERAGGEAQRCIAALAGGAQVFKVGSEGKPFQGIGAKNVETAVMLLEKAGVALAGNDTGGNLGRTFTFTLDSGLVTVKTITKGEQPLCNLRG